jgi:formylglycine-generating enzyme required for sulfatase activity
VAGSLAVVHDLGVVHGGITPLGVMIQDSRIYLSDFGLSSAHLDGKLEGCRPGGRLGLLLYASPALINGDAARGLEASDDLFALGALVLHAVSNPGAGDQRAGPDSPWLVAPPISPGFRTIRERLLCLDAGGRYGSARAALDDLNRVASGGQPAALAPGAASVRGRRADGAVAQRPVSAQMFERLKAPSAGEIAVPPAVEEPPALQETHPDEYAQEEEWEEEDEFAAERERKQSDRRAKAPSKSPSRRLDGKPPAAKRKGGGWLLFAFTFTLLVGGGALGVKLGQPVGPTLTRSLLLQAEVLAETSQPLDYGAAAALARRGLDAAGNDAEAVRDVLAFLEALDRRAQDERAQLLPEKATDPASLAPLAAKLEDLRQRTLGLSATHLLQHDVYLAEKQGNRHFWMDTARHLVATGHLDEALLAYQKADSDKGQAFVKLAKRSMAFVPGGPYVIPDKSGQLTVAERKPCYVGRTEVTRKEYAAFLASIAKREKPHRLCDLSEEADKSHKPAGWTVGLEREAHLPATGIDLHDAVAYAAWLEKDMVVCDAATLAAAARGAGGRAFPWSGASPGLAFTNAGGLLQGVAPAGSFPGGAGSGGALDLLGNVAEWTTDKDAGRAAVFGGHYDTPLEELNAGSSEQVEIAERRPTIGFRVMRIVEPGR